MSRDIFREVGKSGANATMRPGEFLARALLVTFGIGVLLGMAGCWTDGGSISACKKACLPLPVAKMSAEGCVCFTGCPEVSADGGAR